MALSRLPRPAGHRAWRSERAAVAETPVGAAVAALRRGREAVVEIDGQLDEVLGWLGDPSQAPPRDLPDRMARSKRRAAEALAAIDSAPNDLY